MPDVSCDTGGEDPLPPAAEDDDADKADIISQTMLVRERSNVPTAHCTQPAHDENQ